MCSARLFCMQYVCGVLRSGAFDGMLQNAKGSRRVKSKELSFCICVVFFLKRATLRNTPKHRRDANFNTLTDM